MGRNFKLTGAALSVATVFGVLASGAAVAGPLDTLSIPQVIVNPPASGVGASLAATGATPAGSIGVIASTSGGVTTTLGGPLGDALTGALGNVGGGSSPLAPLTR
ncbi:hypothetical protein G3N57_35480, partial [Paraburkholderia sp. Se-20369]|nr:hypothetical protein [Paraburkholderia sp. Se-20369]